METSRSGAGGKIVTNRRKQRLAATPYDRPPPPPSPPPPSKSPNWFSGIIIPSARALASGAGKIFSSIFSESESSSSEEDGSASEDDADNDNQYEIPFNGVNALNKENVSSSEIMRYGQESQLVWRRETKKIIEQLIMKETFSREECDRLIKLLNSRVMDWSMEAGEKSSAAVVEHEDVDKAIEEAKKWFQGKKVGPDPVTELVQGACNLSSTALEYVETGGGSPVDVARSYMKERPPWASPGRDVELRTPLTTKLFKEGTLYSVGHDSMSSSKKRSSFASGSWNIQEELRRVRSRATEDMLRSPSTKTDPSLFAVAQIRVDSARAGDKVSVMGERMSEWASLRKTLDSGQDGKASEAMSSKQATSVSGNNEVLEAVTADADCPASKLILPSSPNHAEEQHTDMHSDKVNGSPPAEVTEFDGNESLNGLSSSQVSLLIGVTTGQNYEQRDDEDHKADTSTEKPTNTTDVEGKCELLSEAYMEVPIVTDTNLTIQNEEVSVDMVRPSPKGKGRVTAGKQQGRKPSIYNRKSRGRGK